MLIKGTVPGGNAEASGKILRGDTIAYVCVGGDSVRTEGFDFDSTIGAISKFASSGAKEITFIMKRLAKRADVSTSFMMFGNQLMRPNLKAGTNLREEVGMDGWMDGFM